MSDLNKHRFLLSYFSIFSLVLVLRRYIKHSRQCLTTSPNTLKFIKNTLLCVVCQTLFSVFGTMVKRGLLCLIYYILHISFPHIPTNNQKLLRAPTMDTR